VSLDDLIQHRLANLRTPAARLRVLALLANIDRDSLGRAAGVPYWRTVKILQGKAEPTADEIQRFTKALAEGK